MLNAVHIYNNLEDKPDADIEVHDPRLLVKSVLNQLPEQLRQKKEIIILTDSCCSSSNCPRVVFFKCVLKALKHIS
ncbi:hypothetical protein CI610_03672 [invertebrate metagenome]|uniref:Uncharacterized protein n=1 Tax=invertebrate metagenome TaxID=1711999 RepID=A0A2H9T2H0_9ZZZZ